MLHDVSAIFMLFSGEMNHKVKSGRCTFTLLRFLEAINSLFVFLLNNNTEILSQLLNKELTRTTYLLQLEHSP